MKIGQRSLDDGIDQALSTRQSAQTTGAGQGLRQSGRSSTQVGLDRAELSDVAQTASWVVGASSAQRSEQVAKLTQLYRSGQFTVDPSTLTSAIIDHDSAADPTERSH